MIKLKQAIVVEGKYDIIKLKNIIDTQIIETRGFSVFKDKDKLKLLRLVAKKRGLIILTDSDGAGFVIRNYLKGALPKEQVIHAFIPDVFGKEKRKEKASKEGKLGVEGIVESRLIEVLKNAGATFLDNDFTSVTEQNSTKKIKKSDLFELGIYGRDGSDILRKNLLKHLDLPEHLSVNAMIDVLNMVYNYDDFMALFKEFSNTLID